MTPSPDSREARVEVTQADRELAESVVSAANIVTCDGYYEIDIDRVAETLARHRATPIAPAGEVEYEIWQKDAFGDGDAMVAGSTSLPDAQHYAAVYSQDAPAWVVEVTRRPLPALTGIHGETDR